MSQVENLVDQLERAFRGGAWHGPALAETLRGVDEVMAAARPIPSAHTIWEVVRHVSFWQDAARRRLDGEKVVNVPAEIDWSRAATATSDAWTQELAALEESHQALRARILELSDSQLDDPVTGSDPTVRGMLFGVLQHTGYHAGQIVLLRRAATGRS